MQLLTARISAHLNMVLVTWRSHDHVHCMGKWARICNHISIRHSKQDAKAYDRMQYDTLMPRRATFDELKFGNWFEINCHIHSPPYFMKSSQICNSCDIRQRLGSLGTRLGLHTVKVNPNLFTRNVGIALELSQMDCSCTSTYAYVSV